MIRAAFDVTGLELDASGSARAIAGVLAALEARSDVEVMRLSHPGTARPTGVGRVTRGLGRDLGYIPFGLPRAAGRMGVDLIHCPVGLAPIHSRLPVVITVNDVMALERPEWFTRANAIQQRFALRPAARRAACLIVPSEFTRDRAVAALGIDAERVVVAPYGVDLPFAPGEPSPETLERLGLKRPYVLAVGTLQPRKNLEAALVAFERACESIGELRLAVVGARGWRDDELLARVDASPAADRIAVTGRLDERDLVAAYQGAECLVFPSSYEGFGFPPLEAMACGTPVVCSGTTSLPELVGDAALLADPADPGSFADALLEVLQSSAAAQGLVRKGFERAASYTWDRCGELTVSAYRQALAL